MNLDEQIETFLSAPSFAVAGASNNPAKYGYRCYKCYLDNGRIAYALNPRGEKVLGNTAYKKLSELPEKVESLSVITPPAVTEQLVDEAIAYGIKNIWMQPGAESKLAVENAQQEGLNVIYGGPCLLVVLGYRGF